MVRVENGCWYALTTSLCGRIAASGRIVHCMLLGLMSCICTLAVAQQAEWFQTIQTPAVPGEYHYEQAAASVSDSSGTYVSGTVMGALPGQEAGGAADVFVRKYAPGGQVLWTHQIALPDDQDLTGLAADATGVYLTARDWGGSDFVARLDPGTGRRVWSRAVAGKSLYSIAVHASGVYVGGRHKTLGAFLDRLDRNGTAIWSVAVDAPGADLPSVSGIAGDDTGIYVSGELGGALVRKFNFDGNETAQFRDPASYTPSSAALAVNASGVYVAAHDYIGFGEAVYKYAHQGQLQWKTYLLGDYFIGSLALDDAGLYLSTNTTRGIFASAVRRYSLSGSELWAYRTEPHSEAYGISVSGSKVYVTGRQLGGGNVFHGFVVALAQDLPMQLQVLQGPQATPRTDLAVLQHSSNGPTVAAQVRDAKSGALMRRVVFDPAYWPRQMVRLPDVNGNGSGELAVLGAHRITGAVAAEVRDSSTGSFIARVAFDRGYTPAQLAVLPDLNGNGSPEFALLERSDHVYFSGTQNVQTQAEVRDAVTGALIRRVDFTGFGNDDGELELVVVGDSNGNGSPELAALGRLATYDTDGIAISDPLTGAPLRQQFVRQRGGPFDAVSSLTALPDSDGNGVPETAVVTVNSQNAVRVLVTEGRPNTPPARAAPPKRALPFSKVRADAKPLRMITLPDLNGNGYPELAMLKLGVRSGRDEIQVKDGLTGQLIGRYPFANVGFEWRDLAASDDLNGNAGADLVVLQQRQSDGKAVALIKDARTGALIRSIPF
jgi:outer membrane protein assembly factor BamB